MQQIVDVLAVTVFLVTLFLGSVCSIRFRHNYRPQTKFAKVMFLHVSVILFTGGRVSRPIPEGKFGGSEQGRGLQAHTQEGSWGGLAGGSPGPYPGGRLGVLAWGGLQTQVGRGGRGVYPSMHWGRHPPSCRRYASYLNAFLFNLNVWGACFAIL